MWNHVQERVKHNFISNMHYIHIRVHLHTYSFSLENKTRHRYFILTIWMQNKFSLESLNSHDLCWKKNKTFKMVRSQKSLGVFVRNCFDKLFYYKMLWDCSMHILELIFVKKKSQLKQLIILVWKIASFIYMLSRNP